LARTEFRCCRKLVQRCVASEPLSVRLRAQQMGYFLCRRSPGRMGRKNDRDNFEEAWLAGIASHDSKCAVLQRDDCERGATAACAYGECRVMGRRVSTHRIKRKFRAM